MVRAFVQHSRFCGKVLIIVSNTQITIFYSWQSDLPGNETRNIIQDGIKNAAQLLIDTVDVEADRDTKGKYGSPDIAQTIFSKIDEGDVFVADVTAVCKYEAIDKDGIKKTKYMPNPNVMLELGYATHVVGWENVICVLNRDYGKPEDMPFDIANRRLTSFSLKDGTSKGDAKRFIGGVIQETVENILERGKRVKSGFSDLRLGSYVDGGISNLIQPFEISSSLAFVEHKSEILDECLKLVKQIKSIKISKPSELKSQWYKAYVDEKRENNIPTITINDGSVLTPINNALEMLSFKLQKVKIEEGGKKNIIDLCKEYLDIDISQDKEFFNIGNLENKYDGLLRCSCEGTEEEKSKYNSIKDLEYNLACVQMMDWYVTTFDGLLFIPLAIENVSTVYDEDIDIHVKINKNAVEVIVPSKELINIDMRGLEGVIYEKGIIKELLFMPETSDVSYGGDNSYSLADNQVTLRDYLGYDKKSGISRYNSDDYEKEISKFIATTADNSDSEFIFFVDSLKAKEKKWIGPALLIRPLTKKFDVEYTIKSKYSDGSLSGTITYIQ